MKISSLTKFLLGLIPAVFIAFTGWAAYSGQGGIWQTIKNANAPFVDEQRIDTVLPTSGRGVPAQVGYQGGRFLVETRKDRMERFQCSQCHNNRVVKVAKAAEMAHGTIALNHGGQEKPLGCFSCHKEDERDFLEAENGSKIDMDHSYQLCGQCHFRQKKDWAGGAHGKRVSFWAGERVVKNCTFCHDPHSPLFDKRWPKTYSPPYN